MRSHRRVIQWALIFILTASGTSALLHSEESKETILWNSQTPLPSGELGKVVALGREIVGNTNEHPLSKRFVNNALTCSSCHLDAGTDPKAATFLDIASAYPAWSPRENRAITLEDRVLNCFMRSMNGVRPPNGSKVSVAVTAYITWLSSGSRIRMNPEKPLGPHHVPAIKLDPQLSNSNRGKTLYLEKCADCHGMQGQGTEEGPPTWGQNSYNDGAGLSRNDKLAAWLMVAMPLGDPDLTEQEALDIAAFVNSHHRPKFILIEHLPKPERLGEYNAEIKSPEK
ncbi:c-type cytochrome [Rubinisphaera sp.]|uniref:c-type cytochrome n=1 Tax=Rubinisphaera sp. TaxID=2024857 RepID=UPI000C0DCDEB|nr:c-type cytochrome [Rubinisphaera sp.]MBV08222.1 cytochrome C [Rubinisphaera sp.]HCS52589.1 cytochrome C [Planctomycetaceae bacterium]